MDSPLIKGLLDYRNKKSVRFHMPGHKGRIAYDLSQYIPDIDVTEVEGADNLHKARGIIKESQEKAAKLYGTKRAYYSVNGTTGGIYAAITTCLKPGDEILIQRNCHKSIYNALVIGRIRGHFIYPKYDEKNNILTTIDSDRIDHMLTKNKNIRAVVVTYPSYMGICSDIKAIADIVHKHGKILIVDEAHGSHLRFSDKLPISAEEAGADLIVQSTHKTLPAYTQSSILHLNSDLVDEDRLTRMMSMYQSTSPSYILMASLDMAIDYMDKGGKKKLDNILLSLERFKKEMETIDGIDIFTGNGDYEFVGTKILMDAGAIGLGGSDLENILREKYNIEVEMSDLHYALAMVSLMNTKEDLDKLYLALEDIAMNYSKKNIKKDEGIRYIYPEKEMEIYEAFNKDSKYLKLVDARGKISADYIIPYPPGVPILAPGELVSKSIIEYIREIAGADIEILGVEDGKISIIKE